MAKTNKGVLNSLRNIFGIGVEKTKNTDKKDIAVPANKDPSRQDKKPINLKLPDEVQKLYKLWVNDTYENSNTLKNRMERYAALEYAYYNSPIVSLTIDLYADETLQTDSQKEVLKVDSRDRKVKKYIEEFFEKLNINAQAIRDIAWSIAQYGDSFWVVSSNKEEGFTEYATVDPYSVKDRLEFKATDVQKKLNKNKRFNSFLQGDTRLNALVALVSEENKNYADYFKSYLFGYDMGGKMFLPPWNVLHFRSFTTQSEFWPFGRPILINSLAPFRQLQAGKNLMALLRATKFPVKEYKVNTGDYIDPASQWEVVQEAMEEMNNLGNQQTGSEEFAGNSSVWIPDNLLTFNQWENRIDLNQVADIEMLRDDLIMGTAVPKGYLIVDKASFGTSGQALLRQHKPFARKVYQVQTAILEQFTQLVRLQFAITGDYDYSTEFELSMNYPMVEESRDRTQTKNDTLRLAKDTADNLGQAIGLDRGEALPPDVVKQIFSKLSFLDDEDVDSWVDAVIKAKEEDIEESNRVAKNKRIVEKLSQYSNTDFTNLVQESYYQARKYLREGVLANTHYYTSNNISKQERDILEIVAGDRSGGALKS